MQKNDVYNMVIAHKFVPSGKAIVGGEPTGFGRLTSAHARADSFQKRRAAPYFTK